MRHELDARYLAVEKYIAQVCANEIPEQLQSYLYRFGTVLICGNIERSLEIIILTRLDKRAHPRVLNFVKSYFKKGTNYDCEAIAQLLVRFDPQWYRAFTDFCGNNSAHVEGLSSAYAVRNSVAHGGTQSVGSKRLKELMESSKVIIDAVVNITQ